MIRSILNSESFRIKTAELQRTDQPWTAERQENVLRGFIGTLKEAGVNPLQTLGIVMGVVEVFGDEDIGTRKVAASGDAPQLSLMDKFRAFQAPGKEFMAMGDAEAQKLMSPPQATKEVAPFGAAKGFVSGMMPWNVAGKGLGYAVNKGKELLTQAGGVVGRTGVLGKHPSDVLLANAGDPGARTRLQTTYLSQKHPTLHKMVTALFGEKNAPDVNSFFENIGKGEYSKAVGQVGDALTSNDFIQRAAPYVIPGLMGMAATKMMGGGWGTALGVGAGTGYLAGALRPEGGWNIGQYLKDKQAPEGTPSDPNKPDLNKPAPVTTPKETESERLRRESAAHAEGAGKVSTP